MYISLYGEAEKEFVRELTRSINNCGGSLVSEQQMMEFIKHAQQKAELKNQEVEKQKSNQNLILDPQDALKEIEQEDHITICFETTWDFIDGITHNLLKESMGEEHVNELIDEGEEIRRTLFLSNGEWAKEEAKELILADEWDTIVLHSRKNPLDSNRFICIENKKGKTL